MSNIIKLFVLISLSFTSISCSTTPIGNTIINAVANKDSENKTQIIQSINAEVQKLIELAELNPELRNNLKTVKPADIIYVKTNLEATRHDHKIIVTEKAMTLMMVSDSIIISKYPLGVIQGSNNIIISPEKIKMYSIGCRISNDKVGKSARGSLVFSNKNIIASACGTVIYSKDNVACTDCRNVLVKSISSLPIWKAKESF
jgi:hypothetical protein